MQDFARCSRSAPGFWTKLRALKLISTEQNICSEIAIALSTGPRNTWLAWQRSVFKCSRCANHCCAQIPGHHQRRTLNWICQQLITQHHVNTMLQFPNETSYTNSNTKPPECVCVCVFGCGDQNRRHGHTECTQSHRMRLCAERC